MKLLITGGAGFIGANLVRYVIEETDYDVVNLDALTYSGNLDSLSDISTNQRYSFKRIDIRKASDVQKAFIEIKPDAILHLAAESHVDRSIEGPSGFIQTNILGTYNLLQAALEYFDQIGRPESFRFLHVSTDEVYGSLNMESNPFTEKTAYSPRSPYSASKAASDHLVSAWHHTYGLPTLITNCSNNYGPYQFPEKLVPVVILKCLRSEQIPVYGNGTNIRDWLYVRDHASAIIAVLRKGVLGQTYNIGGNSERSNLEVVKHVCSVLDSMQPDPGGRRREDLIEFVKDRPGHDFRYAIDATKICSEIGWKPKETFQSGFRKTIEWYARNEQWWSRILSGEYKMERIGLKD